MKIFRRTLVCTLISAPPASIGYVIYSAGIIGEPIVKWEVVIWGIVTLAWMGMAGWFAVWAIRWKESAFRWRKLYMDYYLSPDNDVRIFPPDRS